VAIIFISLVANGMSWGLLVAAVALATAVACMATVLYLVDRYRPAIWRASGLGAEADALATGSPKTHPQKLAHNVTVMVAAGVFLPLVVSLIVGVTVGDLWPVSSVGVVFAALTSVAVLAFVIRVRRSRSD